MRDCSNFSMNFLISKVHGKKQIFHITSIICPSLKHAYIVLTLKPHFYTVKLGFTGVHINFLISAEKKNRL